MSELVLASSRAEPISRELRRRVFRHYQIGERLPTEKRLSEEFGVALHTVREAIHPLVRDGVLRRQHGSGISVQNWSRALLTAIFSCHDLFTNPLSQPFSLKQAGAYRRTAIKEGLRPQIFCGCAPANDPSNGIGYRDFVQLAQQGRLAGVIHMSGPEDSEWMEPLKEFGIPFLPASDPFFPYFDMSDFFMKAVRHLREEGCRRIALMINAPAPGSRRAREDSSFVKLFSEAMQTYGLEVRPSWISQDERAAVFGAGRRAFERLWQENSERFDGLIVADDRLFQDMAPCIPWMGIRVPEELRIVTHANEGLPLYASFPFTGCVFDLMRYAELRISALLHLINKEPIQRKRQAVGCDLVSFSME